jgi:hypothetical protein
LRISPDLIFSALGNAKVLEIEFGQRPVRDIRSIAGNRLMDAEGR